MGTIELLEPADTMPSEMWLATLGWDSNLPEGRNDQLHLLMEFRKQNLKAPRQKLHLILAPQDRGFIIKLTYLCSLHNLFGCSGHVFGCPPISHNAFHDCLHCPSFHLAEECPPTSGVVPLSSRQPVPGSHLVSLSTEYFLLTKPIWHSYKLVEMILWNDRRYIFVFQLKIPTLHTERVKRIYSTLNNGVGISQFMTDRVKGRYGMTGTNFKLLTYPNNMMLMSSNRPTLIYWNSASHNRPQREALGNEPHKLCSYFPEPRNEVYCLRLNFNVSK